MKDKIIELLKQYEDTHTQGVYRCDYDELADEVVKLFCKPGVSGRSEQLKCFIDAEPAICHNPNKNYKDCKDCQHW